MAKDNKVSMPSGIGGLVRYFDEYKSSIELQPMHVVFLCIAVIVFMVLMHMFA